MILYINHRDIYSGAEKVLLDTVCSKEFKYTHLVLVPKSSKLKDECAKRKVPHIECKYLKGRSEFSNIFSYFINLLRLNILLASLVKQYKISTIHSNSYFSSVIIFPLAIIFRRKIKFVWTLHDINGTVFDYALRYLITIVYHHTIVVSKATRRSLWTMLVPKSKISTIYNGISVENREPSRSKNVQLLSIGMIAPWKGQEELIKSVKRDAVRYPLHLIGDNLDDQAYVFHVKSLCVGMNVKFHGFIDSPWKHVAEQISPDSLAILIHTSIMPDPLPTVILESIANAIVPFVSCHGGGCEMIPEHLQSLLVYDPCDKLQIRDVLECRIKYIMDNQSEIIDDLKSHLRNNFSLDSKIKALANIYVS